jgi:multiple sugar transport system substrate-binding protein
MSVKASVKTGAKASIRAVRRRTLQLAGAGALGAVATVPLVACAAPGSAGAPGALSQEPLTLRWGVYSDQPLLEAAKKALPAFSARYPNITVAQELNTQSGLDYTAQLAGGSAPDLFAACCHALPVWAPQGLVVNLDPLLKRDSREVPLADYGAPLLKYWHTPERGQFALPMSAFTRGLYYNKTLFRRKGIPAPDASWDWARFREAMVQLNQPDQQQWGWHVPVDYERTGHYIRQNGGLQVDPKDNSKATFDSTPALGALQWMHDRMWKDNALARASDVSALGVQAVVALARGNLGMVTEGSWKVTQLLQQAPAEADQWDIAVLPKGAAQRASHASTDGWAIFSASKQPEAAWALMKFTQGDAWMEPAISLAGHVPARKSWLDRYPQLMKQAYPQLADKNLAAFTEPGKQDYAFPLQLYKKHLDSKQVYEDTVAAVFTRNERPLADAFRDAAKQITAINTSS